MELVRLEQQLCAAIRKAKPGKRVMVPEAGRMLWSAFAELSEARTYSVAGANPIQLSEIRAWCELMGVPLAPRHVRIIAAMDHAWLETLSSKEPPKGVKTLPPISEQPLTAALLDAVMG